MRSRNSPRRTRDDLEFPIRIRVRLLPNPPRGLDSDVPLWLLSQFGRDGFAHRRMDGDAGPTWAFYFHRIVDAQTFMSGFPEIELDEGTASRTDAPPWLGKQVKRGGTKGPLLPLGPSDVANGAMRRPDP